MKSEIVFIKIIGYMFYSQYNYHISHHNYQFSFLSITLHVVEKPLLQQLRNLNLFVSRSTFALKNMFILDMLIIYAYQKNSYRNYNNHQNYHNNNHHNYNNHHN